MERHIGIWYKEGHPESKEVGELIIDGNSIDFLCRFHGEVFPCAFIGNDGEFDYKVFVNGQSYPHFSKTVDHTSSYRVYYVLMKEFEFSKGIEIEEINDFSFTIPEIIQWLGNNTVSYGFTNSDEIGAYENNMESIILNETDPHIEICFESKTLDYSFTHNDSISKMVKQEPRIKVVYEKSQNIKTVIDDIECLMQFFGLLMGSVNSANDIRLSVGIENKNKKSWLYLNYDFSYNTKAFDPFSIPRTYLYVVNDKLPLYYISWREFYFDDRFSLLRRIYFSTNNKKDYFIEEQFIQYMRIIDGYQTRISGGETTRHMLRAAIKTATKDIKRLIFTDEGKPIFENSIKSVLPDWKFNSSHVEDIAGWIASGYIAKKSLASRLQELDDMYLSIIRENAVYIENQSKDPCEVNSMTEEEIIQLYYKELGDTRNYYSHYKMDKSGVLENNKLLDSVNVLKATIISIFFSHMNMERELIRHIMAFDSELRFQTKCLRNENDKPFKRPCEATT